jgi:cytochrome c2
MSRREERRRANNIRRAISWPRLVRVPDTRGSYVAPPGPYRRTRRTPFLLIAALWTGACRRPRDAAIAGGDPARGREAIYAVGCGSCHVIGGVPGARGTAGPPLDGISHRHIIGGRLPNTPDNMVRWILDPGQIKPGVAMPSLAGVRSPAASARDIVAYLYTLE